jgi:hypothetical protein
MTNLYLYNSFIVLNLCSIFCFEIKCYAFFIVYLYRKHDVIHYVLILFLFLSCVLCVLRSYFILGQKNLQRRNMSDTVSAFILFVFISFVQEEIDSTAHARLLAKVKRMSTKNEKLSKSDERKQRAIEHNSKNKKKPVESEKKKTKSVAFIDAADDSMFVTLFILT